MKRGYNFSAGPAMLPESLLKIVQSELLDWNGTDRSIMEIGHRSEAFTTLLQTAEKNLRQLIHIPDNYRVLFLGGAARTQFAMIAMNFIGAHERAGYIVSGLWSKLAYQEASRLSQAYIVASNEETAFLKLPDKSAYQFADKTAYVYYTPNETVNGIQFFEKPEVGGLDLIADMTSCLLTEPVDIKHYALIFAGAQKNIANAGLTLVILRDDLLDKAPSSILPTMLDYRVHVKHESNYATPPVFNCYIAAKMFEWIKKQGGVENLYQINCLKAEKLYQFIDASDYYECHIEANCRSNVNVCFSLPNPALEDKFITEATENKLYALKGHRVVGGIRASLYNAMPLEGVEKLIEFMTEFSKENQR